MDDAVGKVLKTLDEEGLAENTLVIFTSDNGGLSTSEGSPTSNLPYRAGKGWLYEGGFASRCWCVIHSFLTAAPPPRSRCIPPILPDHPRRHRSRSAPRSAQGRRFFPALSRRSRQKAQQPSPHLALPALGKSGRLAGRGRPRGKWELIRWEWPVRTELFDLEADPGEQRDVSADHPEVVSGLNIRIDSFLSEAGAYQTAKNPNFKGEFKKW